MIKEVQNIKDLLKQVQTSALQPLTAETNNTSNEAKPPVDELDKECSPSDKTKGVEKPQDIDIRAMTVKSELSKRGIQFAPKALKVQFIINWPNTGGSSKIACLLLAK